MIVDASVAMKWLRPEPDTAIALQLLGRSDLIAPDSIRWNAPDGLSIQGWLYRPKTRAMGTVVDIHGGPTHHLAENPLGLIQSAQRGKCARPFGDPVRVPLLAAFIAQHFRPFQRLRPPFAAHC